MTAVASHTDVQERWQIPTPIYFLTYRGHSLHALNRGSMQECIDWLADKSHDYAVIVNIDGEEREVARGRAALR